MTALTATRTAGPRDRGRTGTLHDVRTVFVREFRPVLRDPFSLIFSLVQPLVFLGLFGPVLVGGSGEPAETTLRWFVPGILVMIALFGAGTTGSNLLFEMQTGSHERTLVLPVSRASLLVGRALKEMGPIVVQALVIAVATVPFGFDLDPLGALVGLVLMALFGLGFGAFSYALALASRNRDWMFWGVQQATVFPLMILSGLLMPLDAAPGWMKALASVNPVRYVTDAERALFAGDVASRATLEGFVAAAVLAVAGLAVGIRSMRRAN